MHFLQKSSFDFFSISIENKLAIYNTELLRLYTDFDTRVAPLGFAIKRWAKLYGINDASVLHNFSLFILYHLITFFSNF